MNLYESQQDAIHRLIEDALKLRVERDALRRERDEALASRDWYKRRCELLQQWQSKMRDPERTIVCDILANGAVDLAVRPELAALREATEKALRDDVFDLRPRSRRRVMAKIRRRGPARFRFVDDEGLA